MVVDRELKNSQHGLFPKDLLFSQPFSQPRFAAAFYTAAICNVEGRI